MGLISIAVELKKRVMWQLWFCSKGSANGSKYGRVVHAWQCNIFTFQNTNILVKKYLTARAYPHRPFVFMLLAAEP
ncbi:hypothetical protein C0068_12155 [Zhongshania marina]|uniref:Uncharacterized protein n=1 Tax=Zhongshania marina TaxID=2304603 RepID=A0A2S4HEZ5_9GAMM|nr:hypothetical protein C0068_12155 [Marortus luteolus]